jgi:uncharacterized membrane protein YkvA (DUF1232 family)
MKFLLDLKLFIKNLFTDQRLPLRDRALIIIFIFLLISPIDFVPDWVPFFGLVDDFMMITIIFNYLFKVLDSRIVLSHYPWGMKSFARLRAISQIADFFIPSSLKKKMWKYVADPF